MPPLLPETDLTCVRHGPTSQITAIQLQAFLSQYQSAKWSIALEAPGTGITEAAKAMASDGYGVFTTRYLVA